QQLRVGEAPDLARLALPDDGGLVLAGAGHVPVEAVLGQVQGAVDEPFGKGRVPLQDPVPLPRPLESRRLLAPEALRVLDAALVEGAILLEALDVGLLLELWRGREDAALLEGRVDVAHGVTSSGMRSGATSGWRSSSVSPARSRTRSSMRPPADGPTSVSGMPISRTEPAAACASDACAAQPSPFRPSRTMEEPAPTR